MKQQKAMLIALIVICLTVIVTALVTRKDLCEVRRGRLREGAESYAKALASDILR
ncbi:TPA: Hok/Gef family protein [Escherichia coli]